VVEAPVPRIGVFGGLFNPPHIGHLSLCQEAAWQLGLERVVLVPTGRPAHRSAPQESPEMRLRLAQAAALGNPMFTVSRLEVDRLGPSYTVDTLRDLSHRYPG
jgi:nicotinate-nucleotide adenylyltransferase